MTISISTEYCTLQEIVDASNVSADYVQANPEYAMAIKAASRTIDQATGGRFYPDADAEQQRKFWPTSSGYCMLFPLNTFTSLADRDGDLWTLDQDFILEPINATIDGQPYTAVRATARPFLFSRAEIPASSWSILDGRITVTGNFGWATVPDDVRLACALLARRFAIRFRDAPLGIYSAGSDNPAIRLARTDPDVYTLLQPYAQTFVV